MTLPAASADVQSATPNGASYGWVVASRTLVRASVLFGGPLVLYDVFALLWFWLALTYGVTCSVGFQPWCERGHGLVAYYLTAAAVLVAVTLWVLALVAAVRGQAHRSVALLLVAATAAVIGVAATLQM